MIAIGLVLLVLALIVGAGVLLSNDQLVSAEAFGVSVNDVSLGVFFLIGAAVGAVVLLGLALMLAGAARSRAKKKAIREETEGSRVRHESLAEQNARLQAELEASRGADGSRGADRGRDRDGDDGRDGKHDRGDDSDRTGDEDAMRDRSAVAAASSPATHSTEASSERTTVQERPVAPARRDTGEPAWSPTSSPGAAPTTGTAGSAAPGPGVAAGTGSAAAAVPAVPPAGAAPTPSVLPADSSDSGTTGDDGAGKHVATATDSDDDGDGRGKGN